MLCRAPVDSNKPSPDPSVQETKGSGNVLSTNSSSQTTTHGGLEINLPEVVREVKEQWTRYNQALGRGDVDTLKSYYYNSPNTVRFGRNSQEHFFSHEELTSFTGRLPINQPVGIRILDKVQVNTIGQDMGNTNALFHVDVNADASMSPGRVHRQTHTWIRTTEGWKIMVSHASLLEPPPDLYLPPSEPYESLPL